MCFQCRVLDLEILSQQAPFATHTLPPTDSLKCLAASFVIRINPENYICILKTGNCLEERSSGWVAVAVGEGDFRDLTGYPMGV